MPKKYISCVRKVRAKGGKYNPFAVCRISTGYYGSSHNIGLINPIRHKGHKCPKCGYRH